MVNLKLKTEFMVYTSLASHKSVCFYYIKIFDLVDKERVIKRLTNITGLESILINFYKNEIQVICGVCPLIGKFDGLGLYLNATLLKSFEQFECIEIKVKSFNKYINAIFKKEGELEFVKLTDGSNNKGLLSTDSVKIVQVINLVEIVKLWVDVKKLIISDHHIIERVKGTKYTLGDTRHMFFEFIRNDLDTVIDEVVSSVDQLKYYNKRALDFNKSVLTTFLNMLHGLDEFKVNNTQRTHEKVEASFDCIEFKDGVYQISFNKFYSHAELENTELVCWGFVNENYLDLITSGQKSFIKYIKDKYYIDIIERNNKNYNPFR